MEYPQSRSNTHARALTRAHTHTYIHTHTHKQTRTHAYIYIYIYIYKNTQIHINNSDEVNTLEQQRTYMYMPRLNSSALIRYKQLISNRSEGLIILSLDLVHNQPIVGVSVNN